MAGYAWRDSCLSATGMTIEFGKRTLTDGLPRAARAQDDDAAAPGKRTLTEGMVGRGNTDPGTMQSLYYGINPPRHAEKAYQAEDSSPPLHPRPTTVGKSGVVTVLATTLYNKPPFGKRAQFSICDRGGRALYTGTLDTPGRLDVPGFAPGSEVLIRPETIGTMVKLLTPEHIAGAADQDAAGGGGDDKANGKADDKAGGGGDDKGDDKADAGATGNMDPGSMHSLYYGINPPRHAEKAYQASDPAPPLHPRGTMVGESGVIIALATTVYNKPPFGKQAQFSICDRSGRVLHTATIRTPGKLEIPGFEPGSEVLIKPESMGTMVKLLTPEQIAGSD